MKRPDMHERLAVRWALSGRSGSPPTDLRASKEYPAMSSIAPFGPVAAWSIRSSEWIRHRKLSRMLPSRTARFYEHGCWCCNAYLVGPLSMQAR